MTDVTPRRHPGRQHRSVEDRITQAALELIAQNGYGGVSMSAIAATSGVARQTVYNHYPDVDSIVGAAVDRHNTESLQTLESLLVAIDSPTGKLDHLVRHHAVVAEHAHGTHTLHHSLSQRTRASVESFSVRVTEIIEGILREGVSEGLFRQDVHPQRDAVLIQHILEGVTILVITESDQIPAIVNTAIRTVRAVVSNQAETINNDRV